MNQYNCTEISEPVKAGVVFEKTLIKPKWFVWNNRKYNVDNIAYAWIARSGSSKSHFFSVQSGGVIYEISYNIKLSIWKLEKIYAD